jgi:hypothetical protein
MPRLSSRKRVRKSACRGKRKTCRRHRAKTNRRKGKRSSYGGSNAIAFGSSYGGTLSPIAVSSQTGGVIGFNL